jgi:hypothetical protein
VNNVEQGRFIIEVIAVATIPLSIIGVLFYRVMTGRGMSVRSMQFLAVSTMLPAIIFLSLEGLLEKSAVGALLGAFIGYLLSNIGEYDRQRRDRAGNPLD